MAATRAFGCLIAKDQQVKRGVIILAEIFDLNKQAEVGLLSYNRGRGDVDLRWSS